MGYYLLLVGAHQETLADGKVKDYEKGDVVESPKDLQTLFGCDKFRALTDRQAKRLLAEQKKQRQEQEQNDAAKQPGNPLFSK
jgi:hypothetical protein